MRFLFFSLKSLSVSLSKLAGSEGDLNGQKLVSVIGTAFVPLNSEKLRVYDCLYNLSSTRLTIVSQLSYAHSDEPKKM